MAPRLLFATLWVSDVKKATAFYAGTLGLEPAESEADQPAGDDSGRALLAFPGQPAPLLVLAEPPSDAVKKYAKAIRDQGLTALTLGVDDVRAEWERLERAGVVFEEPADVDDGVRAVFDDSVGNLIELLQVKGRNATKEAAGIALAREQP